MSYSNKKILILYFDKPTRVAVHDLLYCYQDYSESKCYYYSLKRGKIPKYLLRTEFDLIIFHTCFLSHRWIGTKKFKKEVYPLINSLRDNTAVKIAMPQDEWIHTNILNDLINDFKITIVFSVAPESEWRTIYNNIDFTKVRIHKVLTGYISSNTVRIVKKLELKSAGRDIDIGYRAFQAPVWLGKHGYLKTKIADVIALQARAYKLRTDISTKEKDTFHGDHWLNFLLRCKYFIGVEGGSTVFDPDGTIWKKGTEYLALKPNATYEEVEVACFSGLEGSIRLIAISPRHLEAVITKTCQILIEGDYNGILKPEVHYLELKKDFSNLREIMEILHDDQRRESIADRAYKDIVLSEKYSYRTFTEHILNTSLKKGIDSKISVRDANIYFLNSLIELYTHIIYSRKITKCRSLIYYYFRKIMQIPPLQKGYLF